MLFFEIYNKISEYQNKGMKTCGLYQRDGPAAVVLVFAAQQGAITKLKKRQRKKSKSLKRVGGMERGRFFLLKHPWSRNRRRFDIIKIKKCRQIGGIFALAFRLALDVQDRANMSHHFHHIGLLSHNIEDVFVSKRRLIKSGISYFCYNA